jgi:hypothetical protein
VGAKCDSGAFEFVVYGIDVFALWMETAVLWIRNEKAFLSG